MDGLSDEDLRLQLQQYGVTPGPINDTTRKGYLKKLDKVCYFVLLYSCLFVFFNVYGIF